MFTTGAECKSALASGEFSFYKPKFFGLHDKELPNGSTRVKVPLEQAACIHMQTTAGMKYVPQPAGTELRAFQDANGNLTFYARHDCGNPVDEVLYPSPLDSRQRITVPVTGKMEVVVRFPDTLHVKVSGAVTQRVVNDTASLAKISRETRLRPSARAETYEPQNTGAEVAQVSEGCGGGCWTVRTVETAAVLGLFYWGINSLQHSTPRGPNSGITNNASLQGIHFGIP
jgi:hypothetical protein